MNSGTHAIMNEEAVRMLLLKFPSPADWPAHDKEHYRTLLGARLFDSQCLRCRIERAFEAKCTESDS